MRKEVILFILIISILITGCDNSSKKIENNDKIENKSVEKIDESTENNEIIVDEKENDIVNVDEEKSSLQLGEEENREENNNKQLTETKKIQLKISYNSIGTMKQNQEHQIDAKVSNEKNVKITYDSSNEKCTTVDNSGNLKAVWISNKEKCTSNITITATKDGNTKKESFTVTVKEDTTPPTIECKIYAEKTSGVTVIVDKKDDESGLKEGCNPYCIVPTITNTTTYEVYDKAGNVSTCTITVTKDCPRGYTKDKPDSCKYQGPVSIDVTYVNSCEETGYVFCEEGAVTGEEAEKLCNANTCYKKTHYYCANKDHYMFEKKYCLGHSPYVYLGKISYD